MHTPLKRAQSIASDPRIDEKKEEDMKRLSTDSLLRKVGKDNVWFCCKRGRTDARLLQYLATITFSFIILIFSIVQLYRLPPGVGQNTYVSLITLVFGIFIPRPKVNKP